MREGELTYDDFLRRLNIQDVLIDAGYHLNRRDGLALSLVCPVGQRGAAHPQRQIHCHAAREMLFQTATAEVV